MAEHVATSLGGSRKHLPFGEKDALFDTQNAGAVTLIPTVAAIAGLLLLPGLYTVVLSLYDQGWTVKGYKALISDASFYRSVYLSLLYAAVTVLLQMAIGTFTAAVIHRLDRAVGLVSTLLFLPYAVPSVVAVVSWEFLLRDKGLLALWGERHLHINSGVWMGDWIFVTLVLVSVWQFYPFVYLTLLARMRRIPPALYRSARLDGATHWQQFKFITFPAIKSTLIVVVLLRTAFMITKFDTPWLLGGGTANQGVRTLPIYINEMRGLDVAARPGVAAAVLLALMLLVPITIIVLLQRRPEAGITAAGEEDEAATVERAPTPPDSQTPADVTRSPLPNLPVRRFLGERAGIKAVVAVPLALTLIFSVTPYVTLFVGSLLPNSMTDRGVSQLSRLSLNNYVELLGGTYNKFFGYLGNTVVVSVFTTLSVAALSIMGAYGLSRFRFRFRESVRQSAMFGYLFPPIILVFPYSSLLQFFGLNGTYLGLILANVAFCFPFGLWLMVQYMEAIPEDVDRAAAADGSTWWRAMWHVIIPRALPGIFAVSVFTFILSWNDVALSLVLARDDTKTIAAGVKENILDTDQSSYSTFAAASFLVATCAIAFFGWVQYWVDRQLAAEAEEAS